MQIRVYGRSIKPSIADRIISRVKARRGLENVDDQLVAEKIEEFLKSNKKILKKLYEADDFSNIAKSKEVKDIVKHTRSELRPIYGLFVDKNLGRIKDMLKKRKMDIDHVLEMHKSSKERRRFYRDFYRRIFEITGKPSSIIDIAAGLNPFSFPYMDIGNDVHYTALELNQNDTDLIQEYFDKASIKGKALKHDITKKPIKHKADIAFAFKIFDLVDSKITERIIKELKVEWIAASFSTKTVSKKDMRFRRRSGFQKMLRRLDLEYRTIEFSNEIVYLIRKEGLKENK